MGNKVKYINRNMVRAKEFPYEFREYESCWAISAGKDGRIYVSLCSESKPALACHLFAYDPKKDKMLHLADIGEVTKDDPKSGRAPQCKIHFGLCSARDGTIYGGTHCASPPLGERYFGVYETYGDPQKGFRGAYIIRYNPKTDKTSSLGMVARYEGIRIMTIDRERKRLYGITYPRSHFFVYDIETKKVQDKGRITENNPYGLVCDEETGNVYTADDTGYLLRYNPEKDKIEKLWVRIPHPAWRFWELESVQSMIKSPDGNKIYGVGNTSSHLFEFNLRKEKITDLGIIWGKDDPQKVHGPYTSAIAFGMDGKLYCSVGVASKTESVGINSELKMGRSFGRDPACHIISYDPETGKKVDFGALQIDDRPVIYTPQAATGLDGAIYFAEGDNPPYTPRLIIFYPPKK